MMTKVESLRREICELTEKHTRGDVPQRTFEKQHEKLTVAICQELVRERLAPNEPIVAEHHVIHAHTKLAGSVLRESEQERTSLFATDRRVFRVSSREKPGEPVQFRAQDRDTIEEIPFSRIRRIVVRRQMRIGEIIAGAVIAAVAVYFRSWLQVTGIALVLLGVAGVLHGLLIPTRWAEIIPHECGDAPIQVHALRKRSAKKLIKVLAASTGRG
jgi:hypothetical protein